MRFWDGSGINWTICKQSVPRSRHNHAITTGRTTFLPSNQQCQSTEGSWDILTVMGNIHQQQLSRWHVHRWRFVDLPTARQHTVHPADDTQYTVLNNNGIFWGTIKTLSILLYESNCCRWLHWHTHPFNGPLSGTTRMSRYQKGKTNLDFTEARDSEWQWHQLGRIQVCISLQTDNHTSTPPLSFLQTRCPSWTNYYWNRLTASFPGQPG